MACKFPIEFKPGDDLKWAGVLEQPNVTDFTGYELAAEFRAKNRNSKLPATLLATGTCVWDDVLTGAFFVIVSRTVTADWPLGIIIMMDIRVQHPDGTHVRTETLEFPTIPGVTEPV